MKKLISINPKCKECGSTFSKIIKTKLADNGLIIRKRKCLECAYCLYTGQPIETVLQEKSVSERFKDEGNQPAFLTPYNQPQEAY